MLAVTQLRDVLIEVPFGQGCVCDQQVYITFAHGIGHLGKVARVQNAAKAVFAQTLLKGVAQVRIGFGKDNSNVVELRYVQAHILHLRKQRTFVLACFLCEAI